MSRQLKTLVIDGDPGGRTCGTCSLCCTVQGVEEIAKPVNVRCDHLTPMGRCGIYATRPQSCRDYKCLWLRGFFPEAMKPVRSRAVIEPNADGDILVMRVLPQDRAAIRRGILREFIRRANSLHIPVIVICGESHTIFGPRDQDLDIILNAQSIENGQLVSKEVTFNVEEML